MMFLDDFSYYAVCVPIYKNQLLFEVRSKYVSQPSEVSFPGGKIEEGEIPFEAASRELREETRLHILSKVCDVEPVVTPFNTVIFPFVVEVDMRDIEINNYEVFETFLVPIDFFETPYKVAYVDVKLEPPDDFPYDLIPLQKEYPWKKGKYKVMFYRWNNYVIWGITARIAHRVAQLLRAH
ncbi:MAG TPA: CoA pyrophosphatase [Fervidobacterium sp.]|nr:CoA pyrophosphatase [Fervidobacterium sp.]HOM73721.1 CoA pyrophosphatase [Fervidobacterium sp.]HPP17498.1 CoA pyrophosphatase [Fervidobacterium sp.]HRD20607.1 CoA pyrophosphatase [Fervidobacterium sp.]